MLLKFILKFIEYQVTFDSCNYQREDSNKLIIQKMLEIE